MQANHSTSDLTSPHCWCSVRSIAPWLPRIMPSQAPVSYRAWISAPHIRLATASILRDPAGGLQPIPLVHVSEQCSVLLQEPRRTILYIPPVSGHDLEG